MASRSPPRPCGAPSFTCPAGSPAPRGGGTLRLPAGWPWAHSFAVALSSATLHPPPDLTAHRHHGLAGQLAADRSGLPVTASGEPPGRSTTSSTSSRTAPASFRSSPSRNASVRTPHLGPRQETSHPHCGSVDPGSVPRVNAVLVLANPIAAGGTASHDQRYLPDAVRVSPLTTCTPSSVSRNLR
jgi:hypothetical protein